MNACAAIMALAGAVTIQHGGDTITLAPHDGAAAQICYYNNGAQNSQHGAWSVTMGDLTVTGQVRVFTHETLTVVPPDGLFAYPGDPAAVADGEHVVIFIVEPQA